MAALSIQSFSEATALSYTAAADVICLAHVAANKSTTTARPPLVISAVIDRSGSMGGEKIELVKRSMRCVITNLRAEDQFGIVAFDDQVETVLPMTLMTAAGKLVAGDSLDTFDSRNSTNLSDGLEAGAKLIHTLPQAAREVPSAVWLFTDGQANEGIQDEAGLVELAKKCLSDLPSCSLYTFGFGTDHNASILQNLASSGQGVYYYVENEAAILPSFGDCLGGLVSIVAQNVQMKITSKYKLKEVHTSYPFTMDGDNTAVVRIKDMYSEESRDVLFTVHVEALPAAAECDPVAEVTVTHIDAGTKEQNGVSVELFLERPEFAAPSEVPVPIDEQRNRLDCAAALREAGALADAGDLESARGILEKAIAKIEQSPSRDTKATQGFLHSLRSAKEKMKDRREYEMGGQQEWCYHMVSHSKQRSCVQTSAMYGNSSKGEMAALFA